MKALSLRKPEGKTLPLSKMYRSRKSRLGDTLQARPPTRLIIKQNAPAIKSVAHSLNI